MSKGLCFIDTETLGLDAEHHAIWEVAFVFQSGEEHEFLVRVTPREQSLAHPIALEIGRFAERYDDEKAIEPSAVAFALYDLIPDRTHLAGAVVSFDEERLRRLMWRHALPIPWHYHLVDVEALAAGHLRQPPPWDSNELSKAVGVDPEQFDRHTALGDARWAKAVYEATMRGETRSQP